MSYLDKQGRRVGDCGHFLRPIGPDVYRCDECEKRDNTVTIPRAQLEALMAAVEGLRQIARLSYGHEARTLAKAKLDRLRAAGIPEGE